MGKRIRHVKRYREIVAVLVKYGFGYIVKDVGLFHLLSLPKQLISDFSGNDDSKPVGRKIRQMLEELGPTFIKLGQLLSLRSDIIPQQITDELSNLQDQVTPIDSDEIKAIIEDEYSAPISEVFLTFDDRCIAAASIAQAHLAVLKSGEKVVVKVRRPNIEAMVSQDIDILWDLANLVERHYAWARQYQISDIVEEFSQAITNEMDYFKEARNTEKLYTFFAHDPNIVIPKIYRDYSTKRLITLEYIHGTRFDQLISQDDSLDHSQYNHKIISERLVRAFLDQALIAGLFHGDPHPGNLFFFPKNKIGFIDFGQVGVLTEDMKHHFANLIIGLMKGDTNLLYRTIIQMCSVPDDLDVLQFKSDLEQLRAKYYDLPFKEVHIGHVVHDIFETTKKHRIRIPKNYTLLGKALITLEGMITRLDESISILALAEPYGKKLLLKRFHPEELSKKFLRNTFTALDDSMKIPTLLKKTLRHLYKGRTRVEMELPQLDQMLAKLDRAANRISFSIILLAFSIILAGLLLGEAFGTRPLFSNLPILYIAVMIMIFMFILVLIAIFRSGRF